MAYTLVANKQVTVYLHDQAEHIDKWTLPTINFQIPKEIHIRLVFDPPEVHLSPLGTRQAAKIGLETLQRIIEERIELEPAWMRRFVPAYQQIPRLPATNTNPKSIALRAFSLDSLADYARYLTHYPAHKVWEIADRLRRATGRFIEPCLVDSRANWDRRIPPQGELRRKFDVLVSVGDEISLLEILGGNSASLADLVEQWPERFGPRRRLLLYSPKLLPESTWEELVGARVNASLAPETSDGSERLVNHLLPLLEQRALAVAYVFALMGFTLLGRPLGLTSLLDPRLHTSLPGNGWFESQSDREIEYCYDLASDWIDQRQV
jgi:hypothetical protein